MFFFAVFNSPAMQAAPCPDPAAAPLRRRLNHRPDSFKAESALGGRYMKLGNYPFLALPQVDQGAQLEAGWTKEPEAMQAAPCPDPSDAA